MRYAPARTDDRLVHDGGVNIKHPPPPLPHKRLSIIILVNMCQASIYNSLVSLSPNLGNTKECSLSKTWENEGVVTVENYTYLGVNIDRKLNFEKFINNTISKAQGRLITLARIRKILDSKTTLLIYKQTILPILDYCCFLMESSTQKKIKKLQPLQNKAIRIVKKLNGYISTEEMDELHVELHLRLLSDRRKRFMLMLIYKLSLDDANVNMYRPERMLRTGPKVKMKVPFTDKERVLRSPYYTGTRLWDSLECNVQHSACMHDFKNALNKS